MQEIAPGLWHWTALHDRIGIEVSSYYLPAEGVLIDPMIPREGLQWFQEHGAPEHLLLTNRHHDRHSWKLREALGCEVHCPSSGLYELEGRGPAVPYDPGEELPGGVIAYEVDAICPDESALHIPAHGALACADGIVRWRNSEQIGFVPDELMDDPPQTKRGLEDAYRRLLGLDFHLLLLSHGAPVLTDAKRELQAFLERPL